MEYSEKDLGNWELNMKLFRAIQHLFLTTMVCISTGYAAEIDLVTYYGNSGGIVGAINQTTDKVNGRVICPSTSTPGCDFSSITGFNNNNTIDSTDDYYTGDLTIRTNDAFTMIAAWNWNRGTGGDDTVTITGTLPQTNEKHYYEWVELTGLCDPTLSSISTDKQTIVCVRKDFDIDNKDNKAEDLALNVRVLGGTPNGAIPGEISFSISADQATDKDDSTDGNSLTVTASPRWNLQKGIYKAWPGETMMINGVKKKGWIVDYTFTIESDEVKGEIDSVNPIVGNESMGEDTTFTFIDDMSGLTPNAVIADCSMNGRYKERDGYTGSGNPVSCMGAGCLPGHSKDGNGNNTLEDNIRALKAEQEITCTQAGSDVSIELKHVNATLDHYPTKGYYKTILPINRAIAAIGSIYIFIPLEDVRLGNDNTLGTGDDGQYTLINHLTNFDPTTPTGNSNFAEEIESEADNSHSLTLYHTSGYWDKYYRGIHSPSAIQSLWGDIWTMPGSSARSGDGLITKDTEFSSYLYSINSGGASYTEDTFCDVIDAYRLKIQATQDNAQYTHIRSVTSSAVYTGKPEGPILFRIYFEGDDTNFTVRNGPDAVPYKVEYANTYVDNRFLPSQGGDTSADVRQIIKTECTDPSVVWSEDFNAVINNSASLHGENLGVTKVRISLKDGYEHTSGADARMWINHKVRSVDLANGQPMQTGDIIVDYAAHKFSGSDWALPTYKPGMYPGRHSGNQGDRVIFASAKVRIKKYQSRTSATVGNTVTYTLKMTYTNDSGNSGESGDIKITDVLPKGLIYVIGSTSPTTEYTDPQIGTCSDVLDINVSPCVDGENQVLIWDLDDRAVNTPAILDLNYTVSIGPLSQAGTNINVVKVESSTDNSKLSQRKSDIGLFIVKPSFLDIVKNTEENSNYPAPRQRTKTEQNIAFLMTMTNGKHANVMDLDVIDILPFVGDGNQGAIKFYNYELKREKPTAYHGSMKFASAFFRQAPTSPTSCDAFAVKFYYTNVNPSSINMAPKVSNANQIGEAESIWCEGDISGPNGCTLAKSGFTFIDNLQVTAVRAKGATMGKGALCEFGVAIAVKDNLAGDNYSNSAAASTTGVTLPVLSNAKAVQIVGSTLGDRVWIDSNEDGVQDPNESGLLGLKVYLLDAAGTPVNNPLTGQPYIETTDTEGKYLFINLNKGNYKIRFELPISYAISPKNSNGNNAIDSDVNPDTKVTDIISLKVGEQHTNVDMGIYTLLPAINIEKSTNGIDADTSEKAIVLTAGDTVTWRYIVKNIGNENLENLSITDDKEGIVTCPETTLNVNESMECVVKIGTANSVNYANNAIVRAKGNLSGKEVTNSDVSHYKIFSEVDISIEKSTNGVDADTQDNAVEIIWGDQVRWSYIVKNMGKEQLKNISVNDDKEGMITCPKITLDSNESMTCDVKTGIANKASYVNISTVTAKSSILGLNVTNTDPSHYKVTTAHIGDYFWIDKNANGIQEANEKPVIAGKIELFDEHFHPVTDVHGNHSVTTDNNGKYGFYVKPGTYQVKFTIPDTPAYEGYAFSNVNQSDNAEINNKSYTQTVTVVVGEDAHTLDTGINCRCVNINSDSANAQNIMSMLLMMFFTLMLGYFFLRKETKI